MFYFCGTQSIKFHRLCFDNKTMWFINFLAQIIIYFTLCQSWISIENPCMFMVLQKQNYRKSYNRLPIMIFRPKMVKTLCQIRFYVKSILVKLEPQKVKQKVWLELVPAKFRIQSLKNSFFFDDFTENPEISTVWIQNVFGMKCRCKFIYFENCKQTADMKGDKLTPIKHILYSNPKGFRNGSFWSHYHLNEQISNWVTVTLHDYSIPVGNTAVW